MKKTRARAWLYFFALAAAFACAGSWAASEIRSMRDRSEVAQATEKTKTVCVGRYLVDVPAQAEVDLAGGMLAGFEIVTVEESESAFRARVAARETGIKAHRA